MATAIDVSALNGKPISEVSRLADQRSEESRKALVEARDLYRLCAGQKLDPFTRGKLLQALWDCEKRLGQHPLFPSQAGQDRFVYERFFKGKKDGVFVEIGGYDGLMGSNSYFFEKTLGWSGLVVEASESLFARMEAVRSCGLVHAAVSDFDGEDEFIGIASGYQQMGGLKSEYSEEILKTVRAHPNHQERSVRVPLKRLDTLFNEAGLAKIDFCSIDVEGAERKILAAFDFAAFDISVVAIENNRSSESGSMADLLEPAGYERVGVIGVDEIFAKK